MLITNYIRLSNISYLQFSNCMSRHAHDRCPKMIASAYKLQVNEETCTFYCCIWSSHRTQKSVTHGEKQERRITEKQRKENLLILSQIGMRSAHNIFTSLIATHARNQKVPSTYSTFSTSNVVITLVCHYAMAKL